MKIKLGEILKYFIYSNFRHALTVVVGILVDRGLVTSDSLSTKSIELIALAASIYLPTVLYSLYIKLRGRYRFFEGLKASPEAHAGVVEHRAAEKLREDLPLPDVVTKLLPS